MNKKNSGKFSKFSDYLKSLANLNNDTDVNSTINSIKKSIEFKGANVWILFFAIIIASVGLNVNSTAVIIGAMLISPLMGPINGIGLAIGINDSDLLKTSIQHFAVMVIISIISSTLYFLISPLSDAQSELLARTNPTIYDVLIAFTGGAAGIIASSRKVEKLTVISGVAIATALIPPLCTAGYGLATGQFNYFIGAFYLFFINSFFIALATYLIVRYLHFPTKVYADIKRQKLVKRGITIFSIIIIIPSILLALGMIKETSFNSQAIKYVSAIQEDNMFSESEIINVKREYSKNNNKISLSIVGNSLDEQQINHLKERLLDFGLQNTLLSIKQTSGSSLDLNTQTDFLNKLLDKKDEQLQIKDTVIKSLTKELDNIKLNDNDFQQLSKEIKIQYSDVKQFIISNYSVYSNLDLNKLDTIPIIYIEWKKNHSKVQEEKIANWLKVRLDIDNLKIINQ